MDQKYIALIVGLIVILGVLIWYKGCFKNIEGFVGNLVNARYMGFYDQPTGMDSLTRHIDEDPF